MRLVDADELRNELSNKDYITYTYEYGDAIPIDWVIGAIDNAPTVEITEEQAIDKLHETGWLPLHDKEMTERPTDKWISVSERLPEDMQRVLIWFEYYRYGDYNCMYQTYGFGYVCDDKWSPFINGETGWRDARILAWMPLPEPYKEAENE